MYNIIFLVRCFFFSFEFAYLFPFILYFCFAHRFFSFFCSFFAFLMLMMMRDQINVKKFPFLFHFSLYWFTMENQRNILFYYYYYFHHLFSYDAARERWNVKTYNVNWKMLWKVHTLTENKEMWKIKRMKWN